MDFYISYVLQRWKEKEGREGRRKRGKEGRKERRRKERRERKDTQRQTDRQTDAGLWVSPAPERAQDSSSPEAAREVGDSPLLHLFTASPGVYSS